MNCRVDGCGREAAYKKARLCQKHYFRVRRTGTTQKAERPQNWGIDSSGYLTSCGERQHRKIYRDHYGDNLPDCWSCGRSLSWDMGKEMHIDHINEEKTDNRIENLRASCWLCNVQRSPHGNEIVLTARGRSMSVTEWSRQPDVDVCYATILRRLKSGMSNEEALFAKKKTHRGKAA